MLHRGHLVTTVLRLNMRGWRGIATVLVDRGQLLLLLVPWGRRPSLTRSDRRRGQRSSLMRELFGARARMGALKETTFIT